MKQLYLALCLLLPFTPSHAVELPLPQKPHLVIEGYGVVRQTPDIIKVHFEVSATAQNLSQAKQSVDKTVGKAIKAAHEQEITEEQINASKIRANPQYDWGKAGRQYKGERVSRQVQITLTDPDRYNALIDALLAAGITRLDNIEMDFSQRLSLEQQAMKLALRDAKQRAKNISSALNQKTAGIFQIAPVNQPVIVRGMEMQSFRVEKDKPSGLKLGKQAIEQRVRVVYLLSD